MNLYIVITCGDPGIPVNGNTIGDDFTFGSVVNHTCNEGFVLDGAGQRQCISPDNITGMWSAPLPICNSKPKNNPCRY